MLEVGTPPVYTAVRSAWRSVAAHIRCSKQYYTGTPRRLVEVAATSRVIASYVQLVLADSDFALPRPK